MQRKNHDLQHLSKLKMYSVYKQHAGWQRITEGVVLVAAVFLSSYPADHLRLFTASRD